MANKPLFLDETGKKIEENVRGLLSEETGRKIENHLGLIALAQMSSIEVTADFEEMGKIIARGYGPSVYAIGDQINIPWKDGSTEYIWPFDITHHTQCELESGEIVPGMVLQAHYASPFALPFDAQEAFYIVKNNPLAPGTYGVTMGCAWGSNVAKDKVYQFTLTEEVPVGGMLVGFKGAPDQKPDTWKVISYASQSATEALETVATIEGDVGVKLGTFLAAGDGNINSLHRAAYGYNNYKQSSIRQYLNSDADNWWTPQNEYDRPPAELASHKGFMAGFDQDFLDILGAIKIVTAKNYITDGGSNTTPEYDVTYDKFFLPSLEQTYVKPQASGEGDYWEYYKRTLGASEPVVQYGTYPRLIKYALNAKTSPQHVRLRSANRGSAGYTWGVNSSGGVGGTYASYSSRFAPACVVIGR